MKASILSLACVTPRARVTQQEAVAFAIDAGRLGGHARTFAETIYARSGIDSRASCIAGEDVLLAQLRASSERPRGATTSERMELYARFAGELAVEAGTNALQKAAKLGVRAPDITHVVTVSCTGFMAPGIDHALIERLKLAPTVRRLHVGYMGCHGAINALAAARAIVLSEPSARVLVTCVELCSLHFQVTDRPDRTVANALFADGAAACVVGACGEREQPAIAATGSCVAPNSSDAMSWRIGDHGFEMSLSESVPELIRQHLRPWLSAWLDGQGASLNELVSQGGWAIHPGGPRVLNAVADTLGLSTQAMRASRAVLAAHGNMSSPTVLFTLEQLLEVHVAPKEPIVMLAFGPGLSMEAALLTQ
ncbi:MAG: type III polyketide synthase [Phycisphaerales bacterium]